MFNKDLIVLDEYIRLSDIVGIEDEDFAIEMQEHFLKAFIAKEFKKIAKLDLKVDYRDQLDLAFNCGKYKDIMPSYSWFESCSNELFIDIPYYFYDNFFIDNTPKIDASIGRFKNFINENVNTWYIKNLLKINEEDALKVFCNFDDPSKILVHTDDWIMVKYNHIKKPGKVIDITNLIREFNIDTSNIDIPMMIEDLKRKGMDVK